MSEELKPVVQEETADVAQKAEQVVEDVKEFAANDIVELVRKTDLSNINTFLVLNGGTGVGKTTAIMNSVLQVLDNKCHGPQTMLVVESRSITVEQLRHKYGETDVC